jgi:hypothetical protein
MTLGQADDGPVSIDDVAQLLMDNPGIDSDPDDEENPAPSDEPEQDNSEEETDEESPADEDSDKEASEKPKEQTSGLKFKVPVKGEDGSDTTIEVDEKELIAGYQRHADYTRKTMELGEKEREVTQKVAEKLEEGRTHYLQQAQLARSAVLQLAGLRSPQELAQLAQTDPAQWVVEQQRAQAVYAVLGQLEQGAKAETEKATREREEAMQKEVSRAWGVLGQQGIDKPKLIEIYDKVSTKYGIPKERLSANTDPALVLLMRDAVAYQGLKDKKAEVTKKAQEAPKMPPSRQSVPKNEQQAQRLDRRFSSGKAKLSDLAAYIANS